MPETQLIVLKSKFGRKQMSESNNSLPKRLALLLAWTLLLPGCATTVRLVCPKLPELPALEPQGQNFQDQMDQFLQKSPLEPTGSGLTLPPVKNSTTMPVKP